MRYFSLFILPIQILTAAPEEYVLTDITAWSPAQLAGLPHFDRFVPLAPAGATEDFEGIAHNGLGMTAGNRDFTNGSWVQGSGAFVANGTSSNIEAWLRPGYFWSYSWSYTYWDGSDYHFQNGFVTHSPVQDMNVLGQIVGYATLPGGGSGSGSSSAYSDHAFIRDTRTGNHMDMTPDATRAQARSINDKGQIVGNWSNETESHAFLREADGSFIDFTLVAPTTYYLTPTVVNNHRMVAGSGIVYTVPLRDRRPWVCEVGTVVTQLPFPSQNSPDEATISDVNDHGILVGEAHKSAEAFEKNAVRWWKDGGTWIGEDLNELMADNMDFILDRCIAINDAGHILVSGHLDGAPDNTYNTHRLLLTPDQFAPPTVTTILPVAVSSTTATLRAKVNAANLATTAQFEYGAGAVYGANSAIPSLAGTVHVLAEQPLTGLMPHTEYHFRVSATNAEGTTNGEDVVFTTPWDWNTWSAENFGAGNPEGDANQNGMPDLIDYATGTGPRPVGGLEGEQLTFKFRRSLIADGVTIMVQTSEDMEEWHDGSSYSIAGSVPSNEFTTEISRVPDGPDHEWVTVAADATMPILIVRLKVIMP